jgi:hypothetical protein
MPSLASRPAAKGCPAAHGFSISNKNKNRKCERLHDAPGIIPSPHFLHWAGQKARDEACGRV